MEWKLRLDKILELQNLARVFWDTAEHATEVNGSLS